MRGGWRFIASIISVLLLIGLGLLRSSLYTTYRNELAAYIAGVGMWLTFAYIGFNALTSPETSVLYRLNRRWMSTDSVNVSGMFIMLLGLFFAALQFVLTIEFFL
ncbi:hypothetical protein TFLX_02907 [Thermoflexales bacterium]|nr:hypothetical protein TFLX_02907 [Thermoflexales bacterium]